MPAKGVVKDIRGAQFGRLTVIEHAGWYVTPSGVQNESKWKCLCSCGNETLVSRSNLRRGSVQSCGCLRTELAKARYRKPRAAVRGLLGRYKGGAQSRGLPFSLTLDQVEQLVQGNCTYCGCAPYLTYVLEGSKSQEWKDMNRLPYNGIDRVDNDAGYTPENCVTCCEACNRAKRVMSLAQFFAWIRRINEHAPWTHMKGVS